MPRPSLIVVTGPPGAGKTTLAHALARAVRCPVVSRDEIKEGLIHATEGVESESDLTRRAYGAFFATVRLLLDGGVTVVAEAAFAHPRWERELEGLASLSRLRIVVCDLAPEAALRRRTARIHEDPDRARYHPDPLTLTEYDAPQLPWPTLTVRTGDGYDPGFDAIVAFARGD